MLADKKMIKIILFITSMLVLLALASVFLLGQTKNTLEKQSEDLMLWSAKTVSEMLDSRLESSIRAVHVLASLEEISSPDISIEAKIKRLKKEVANNHLIRIGIADTSGRAITTDGVERQIQDKNYFQRINEGKYYVTSTYSNHQNTLGDEIFIRSFPIIHDNKVVGSIFSVVLMEDLEEMLESTVSSLRSLGAFNARVSLVNSKDGRIIATSLIKNADYRMLSLSNLSFSSSNVPIHTLEMLSENTNGIIRYLNNQGENIWSNYTPMSSNENWVILTSTTKDLALYNLNNLILGLEILLTIVLACMFITLIYMYSVEAKSNEARKITSAAMTASKLNLLNISQMGKITAFDNNFLALLGLNSTERTLAEIDLTDFIEPDEIKRIKNLSVDDSQFEMKLNLNDGKVLYLNFYMISQINTIPGAPEVFQVMALDVTDDVVFHKQLESLAYIDSLTGLPNRLGIMNKLKETLTREDLNKKLHAAILLDLNQYRIINNVFGYQIGDAILLEVLKKTQKALPSDVFIGRFGGDDFMFVIENIESTGYVLDVVRKILKIFDDNIVVQSHSVYLTCSIGAIVYKSETDSDSNEGEIVANCELACRKAKQANKSNFILYNNYLGKLSENEAKMEKDFEGSLQNGEIEIYYQAQYNIKEKAITGFEALMRWNSPIYGIVSPNIFIPLAERSGFILELGKFVVEESCRFIGQYENLGLTVSCNVSPIECMQSDFGDHIIKMMEKYRLKKGILAIEVTESSLLDSSPDIWNNFQKLRDKGINIHLDDFGMGYSSLSYLIKFPIDVIKIDRSFVQNLTGDEQHKEVVRSIVLLAQSLNMEVIAEGVEAKEQMDFLYDMGCNRIQGFYISKPIPTKEIPLLLEAFSRD